MSTREEMIRARTITLILISSIPSSIINSYSFLNVVVRLSGRMCARTHTHIYIYVLIYASEYAATGTRTYINMFLYLIYYVRFSAGHSEILSSYIVGIPAHYYGEVPLLKVREKRKTRRV